MKCGTPWRTNQRSVCSEVSGARGTAVGCHPMDDGRFDRAIAAIDVANAESPTGVDADQAVRVTEWVRKLRPDASEELLLAARAHHIRRWMSPRSSYPDGRSRYPRWRRDLHEIHARE